jgi:electron-transferring-flavoprotein dehydrogenase
LSNQSQRGAQATKTKMEYDVLLVGGSPSNLALAHRLVDLAKQSGKSFSMAILEKGKEFGSHIVSGAISNPHVIKRLFPDYETNGFPIEGVCKESSLSLLGNKKKWDIPGPVLPPGMKKEGYLILSLSKVVYWMSRSLKDKVKDSPEIEIDFFPGFSAHHVLYENNKVVGVQVVEQASEDALDENIYGKVTCFGDKGFISGDLIEKFKLRDNPQIWSVGVKEVWQLPEDKDYSGKVWHTLGFPLVDGSFGGGFIYGMKDNQLMIGMVISLDSQNPNINPQQKLQDLKKHPWVQSLIKDGKLLNYGAALLPEGGYYSLPSKFTVDGAIILGDALGVLDINSLAGIDKSMECGIQAAEVIHNNLDKKDFSDKNISAYKEKVMETHVGKALFNGRYFRNAFQENPRLLGDYLPTVLEGIDEGVPLAGFLSIGFSRPIQSISDAVKMGLKITGLKDYGSIKYKPDYQHIVPDFKPKNSIQTNGHVKSTIYSREDAVFYAHTKYHEGNKHIDEFNANTCVTCIGKYDSLGKETPCVSDCTAEVHRIDFSQGIRKHGMSLENCVQCRTCEIVCPEVNLKVRPTAQGSGPDFMGL